MHIFSVNYLEWYTENNLVWLSERLGDRNSMEIVQNFLNTNIGFWIGAVIGLILILAVGYSLQTFGKRFFTSDKGTYLWSKIMNWVIVFAVVIYTFTYLSESQWMYQTIFELSNTSITPFLIIVLIFAVLIAVWLSHTIRDNILPGVYSKYNVERGVQASINTLLHYSIVLVTLLFSMNALGFNMTSLTVFAGVLGVGVGFGLRNIMNNFISGIIILFDRPIRVGDRVVIDETITDIEKIKIRSTIVRTRQNERMVIPNSYFLEQKFINRSYSSRKIRVAVDIGVTYGEDLRKTIRLIEEAVYELQEEKWEREMSNPDPKVFIEEFGESDIQMKLFVWIDNQGQELEFIIPSDLRLLIYDKFTENNVEFSTPRQDIMLLSEEEK